MILLLALACGGGRFDGDRALERSLATIDKNHDGKVELDEIPDREPDSDGDGVVSPDELREMLDVDPWTQHADDLTAKIGTLPRGRSDATLARDADHVQQVIVRDVLRFLRRAVAAEGRVVPDDDLIDRAARTGSLESIPSKEAMAILRAAAAANGTPLPSPPPQPKAAPPCCSDQPATSTLDP